MNAPCFTTSINPATARAAFLTGSSPDKSICTTKTVQSLPTPRANLGALPPPGIPSGQDPLEGAPLRSFVPRPVETYDDRSFATELPKTWEGEVTTIGTTDLEDEPAGQLTSSGSLEITVDSASTSAFLEISDMLREERKEALRKLEEAAATPVEGRPTCGEEEGRGFISNFDTRYLGGVKCVEYWGAPNGPVPRLFG